MNTLTARALSAGGTIGIVSPASPYNNYSDVLRGIAWWESRGYHVKLAEDALERTDWVAGSPELRARDLMSIPKNKGVSKTQNFDTPLFLERFQNEPKHVFVRY